MISRIKTGISQALDAEFNNVDIYTESIEQGFNEPCFFISKLKASTTQLVGNRYSFQSSFDIQYFPSNEPVDGAIKNDEECDEVAEKLTDILESIIVDSGPIRGTNISNETIDDVLHFFVDYNMITKKDIDKEDNMENFHSTVGVR